MRGRFSRRGEGRAVRCRDTLSISLFLFFPERTPLTGNKCQDQTLPGKRLQKDAPVPAAGCSGAAGAPAPGGGRQGLLPGCGRAPAPREPAAAGGRGARSWLPLGCGDGRCVETNRQGRACCKAGDIILFLSSRRCWVSGSTGKRTRFRSAPPPSPSPSST